MVKTSISLTEQQYAYLKSMVEEGRASTVSAVIQQAVDAHRLKDEADQEFTRGMRELLAERMKEPALSMDEARAELAGLQAERRHELGLDERTDGELAG